jgi:hypothetical protein
MELKEVSKNWYGLGVDAIRNPINGIERVSFWV